MKKKVTFIFLGVLLILGLVFGTIDYNRIKSGEKPLFMLRVTEAGKSKQQYIGLGYRMERYTGVSYKEELSMDNYVKFGLWFYVKNITIKEDAIDNTNDNTDQTDESGQYKKFTKTYHVLNVAGSNDEKYLYITIRQFQMEEVKTVKVSASLAENLKSGKNYEFTFQRTDKNVEDNIESIFENATLLNVKLTDKTGMDQIQDSINK